MFRTIAVAVVIVFAATLTHSARANDNPQVGDLAIGECQETVLSGQPVNVCRDSYGNYKILPTGESPPRLNNKPLAYGETAPAALATLKDFDTELSTISPDAPKAAAKIQDLHTRFDNFRKSLGPIPSPHYTLELVKALDELRGKIEFKGEKVAEIQAGRVAAENRKTEQQAETQSLTLNEMDTQYPGLADRTIAVMIPNTYPAEWMRLGKLLLCMERNKDADDWNVSRDRGGVHVSGLLYQQTVALDFVDHGATLEIVGARYGDRVSLTTTDAIGVLGEIAGPCN